MADNTSAYLTLVHTLVMPYNRYHRRISSFTKNRWRDDMKGVYLLALIPPALNVAGAVWSTQSHATMLGMPVMLLSVIGGVIVTSIVMRIIYLVDGRTKRPSVATLTD